MLKSFEDMHTRGDNAKAGFAAIVAERTGCAIETARKVTELFLKHRLAKIDFGVGRMTVKHGAYLEDHALNNAVRLVTEDQP